jgi:hypothetical protein
MRALAAPLVLLALLLVAGHGVARATTRRRDEGLAVAAVAGALVLHVALIVAGALGQRWTAMWVVAPLLAAGAAGALLWRLVQPPHRSPLEDGSDTAATHLPGLEGDRGQLAWGDVLAGLAVAIFGALAWTRWIALSDFVYHWGIKGHRFFLVGGVDYGYLAKPWNWVLHPDYPNLLPEIFAATAILAGGWSEPPMLLSSALVLGLMVLAARAALASGELTAASRGWALAVFALLLATFGIGYAMAGGADWLVALGLAVALPALLRPPDSAGDLQVALCAALAASSKLEGLTLAAWLLAVQLVRRQPWRQWRQWRQVVVAAVLLGLPLALVAVPWAAQVVRHSLFQPFNTGSFDPSRVLLVGPALLNRATVSAWLGAPVALLLLPALLADRRLRPAAAVCTLQLLTYLWQYLTAPVDTRLLVLTTFPRLLLHLLPAVFVLAALRWAKPANVPDERTETSAAA